MNHQVPEGTDKWGVFLQQNSTKICDVLGKVCWPWSGTNSDTNMGIEHLPTRQRQQILEYNPVWETTKSWKQQYRYQLVLMSTSWCDEAVETNSNPFLCSTGPFWLVSERKVQCHTRPKFGTKASVPSQKPCTDQTHFVQVPAPCWTPQLVRTPWNSGTHAGWTGIPN